MSASDQFRTYRPFLGPFDPCPPIQEKSYNVPPQLFISFQPPNLPQFSPYEALKYGTLWPALYGPYPDPSRKEAGGD
ncbi:spore coat associated protein CotJA [Paenibacillus paeoniae]|uniref:Spore coat associated protein CotJA n=1 Tax=Paenibacillus paeoniae TaxID=2292705 RepID=A0A371PJS8_9BACL|nr:spore coat associated protein CotJA [Paenibacillus paeoniae]REK76452.1 spore coat associated protein CotJA [Paenibacillus paeoniae]